MNVIETSLPGVLIIEPKVFTDPRGHFLETWNRRRYEDAGLNARFVQDNLALSSYGILRGLHYQNPHDQGKLVIVPQGRVFDVAVDIRAGSPYFGNWVGVELSSENNRQMFIPEGFAHGYCVLSDNALFAYKCTDYYHPEAEGGIAWNDQDLGIEWPFASPVLSTRDKMLPRLSEIPTARLPKYKKDMFPTP